MGHFACLFLFFNSPDRPRRRELVQVSLASFSFFFRVNIFVAFIRLASWLLLIVAKLVHKNLQNFFLNRLKKRIIRLKTPKNCSVHFY